MGVSTISSPPSLSWWENDWEPPPPFTYSNTYRADDIIDVGLRCDCTSGTSAPLLRTCQEPKPLPQSARVNSSPSSPPASSQPPLYRHQQLPPCILEMPAATSRPANASRHPPNTSRHPPPSAIQRLAAHTSQVTGAVAYC